MDIGRVEATVRRVTLVGDEANAIAIRGNAAAAGTPVAHRISTP